MLREKLRQAVSPESLDAEKMAKIQVVLKQMDAVLDCAKRGDYSRFEGPRRSFCEKYASCYDASFNDLDFSFSLSAEDILHKTMREIMGVEEGFVHPEDSEDLVDKKMGRGIIGCTGTAKLFCALAAKEGLSCQVVMTADRERWRQVKVQAEAGFAPEDRDIINGHQIIAVEFSDGLHAFDPGYKEENVHYGPGYIEKRETKFKDLGKPEVGANIDMPRFKNHFVTAIISPEEYAKVHAYQDVANLYSSGNMNRSVFTVPCSWTEKTAVQKAYGVPAESR